MQYHKLKDCIDSGRMKLGLFEKSGHYLIVIYCIIPVLIGVYLKIFPESTEQQERVDNIFYIGLLAALIFYIIQYRRLRFVIIETVLSRDEVAEVIDTVAKKLKWKEATRGENYYTATTAKNFLFR